MQKYNKINMLSHEVREYKTPRGAKIAAKAFIRSGKTAVVFNTIAKTATGRLKKRRDGSFITTPAVLVDR